MTAISAAFRSMDLRRETLQVRNGQLNPCSPGEKLKRLFSPSYDRKEIQAVADHIFANLQDPQKKDASLKLANSFVKRYQTTKQGSKISKAFDRIVAPLRPETNFVHKDNQAGLSKWQRYSQDPALYQKHPEFCNFMETSGLLSQVKVTRDSFQEIDGEAAIKVNGDYMKWTEFKSQFKAVYSERYQETFILSKATSEVYTYLDTGKGLQLHHPYLSDRDPMCKLSDEDYAKVLEVARKAVRPGEENLTQEERDQLNDKRTFVLQLVTSHVKGPKTRFHELIQNSKHPYLRLIIGRDNPDHGTKKGDVHEVGYGWKNKVVNTPLIAAQGQFRSPDVWEYMNCEERVVTNYAVTPEEALNFGNYVTEYHRSEINLGNPIGFHLFKQNCSTFVRAGMAAANITVPTETTLKDLWHDVMPLWMVKTNAFIKEEAYKSSILARHCIKLIPDCIKNPLKRAVEKVTAFGRKVLEALSALIFIPLKLALGDASGTGGRAFVQKDEETTNVEPNLKSFRRWFMLSSYPINLPGILQRWQRKQPSTVIYKNPVRFTIVPE